MKRHVLWKGAVAGAVGGLVGSWTMNQAQAAIARLKTRKQGGNAPQPGGDSGESEDATMKAAGRTLKAVAGRELTQEQKKKMGPVVHYAFGAAMGAAFGAVTERQHRLHHVAGPIFGSALFVAADEIGVPLAGLSGSPMKYPISSHLEALAAHLVYGVTTDLVRRGVRSAL